MFLKQSFNSKTFRVHKALSIAFGLGLLVAALPQVEAADPSTKTIGDSKFRIIGTGSVNLPANGIGTLVIKCAGNEQIISTGIDTTQGAGGKGFGVIDDAPTSHRKWVKRLRNLNNYPVKVAVRAICNSKS